MHDEAFAELRFGEPGLASALVKVRAYRDWIALRYRGPAPPENLPVKYVVEDALTALWHVVEYLPREHRGKGKKWRKDAGRSGDALQWAGNVANTAKHFQRNEGETEAHIVGLSQRAGRPGVQVLITADGGAQRDGLELIEECIEALSAYLGGLDGIHVDPAFARRKLPPVRRG